MGRRRKLVAVIVLNLLGIGALFLDGWNLSSVYFKLIPNAHSTKIRKELGIDPALLSTEQQRLLRERMSKARQEKKYILLWYSSNQNRTRPPPPWNTELCGNCETTTNRSLINDSATGAVVFHYRQISPGNMPPSQTRRLDQLYIWYTAEAPASLYNRRKMSLVYEDRYKFNATQTFRRDSGIFHPYGDVEDILDRKVRRGKNVFQEILKNKTRLSAAVVSNCNYTTGAIVRMELLRKIKEAGMDVDTYGRCFGKETVPKSEAHEFEDYLNRYKFYFAFENSYFCRDYITEKFFINGFRAGTVPVAWGAKKEDYEALAPKNSFIFAEDFKSIRHLVDYLNYLDKNDTAYLEYFRWYKMGSSWLPSKGGQIRFCQLCRQIHGINVDDLTENFNTRRSGNISFLTDVTAHRTVPSLRDWFYKNENEECFFKDPDQIKNASSFNSS